MALCQFRTADCRALCNFSVQYIIQFSVRLTTDVNMFQGRIRGLRIQPLPMITQCLPLALRATASWKNYEPASQSQHTRHTLNSTQVLTFKAIKVSCNNILLLKLYFTTFFKTQAQIRMVTLNIRNAKHRLSYLYNIR